MQHYNDYKEQMRKSQTKTGGFLRLQKRFMAFFVIYPAKSKGIRPFLFDFSPVILYTHLEEKCKSII